MLSGCIKDTDNTAIPDQDVSSLVVINNLPSGYEFLGTYPDFSQYDHENIINSGRGIYRDENDKDVYLDVIEFDTASNAVIFIDEYTSKKQSTIERDILETRAVNGQDITIIKSFSIIKGIQETHYLFIWNEDNYVFIVKSNSPDINSGLNLANTII